MKKILLYCIFAIASLVVIYIFLTSTSYTQLTFATILYPPIAYFGLLLFPRKTRKNTVTQPISNSTELHQVVDSDDSRADILDVDKREFLKLIGVAGVSFFLFSIFSKRSEALFFGKSMDPGSTKIKDSAGKEINPAERQPTDGYRISEIDDNFISYYGFTNNEGAWFIMKEDGDEGSFRYVKGDSGFSDSWSNRENLNYDYYHNTF